MLLTCPVCHNFIRISATPAEAVAPSTGASAFHSASSSSTDLSSSSSSIFAGKNRFECRVCQYQRPLNLNQRFAERTVIKPKEVDDVMGGSQKWENADKTDAKCPAEKCDNGMAYFYQVQIRSADEPMTSFFRCTKCGKRWKE